MLESHCILVSHVQHSMHEATDIYNITHYNFDVSNATSKPCELLQGQLTVANGVLFGATSTYAGSLEASLFAINTTDGTILNAVTLNNTLVQNAPSIVNNVLYQGSGMGQSHTFLALEIAAGNSS